MHCFAGRKCIEL